MVIILDNADISRRTLVLGQKKKIKNRNLMLIIRFFFINERRNFFYVLKNKWTY